MIFYIEYQCIANVEIISQNIKHLLKSRKITFAVYKKCLGYNRSVSRIQMLRIGKLVSVMTDFRTTKEGNQILILHQPYINICKINLQQEIINIT